MYNSNIRNESPIQRRVADDRSHSSGCWLLCWSTNQDGFQGTILMKYFPTSLTDAFVVIRHLRDKIDLMELLLTMDVPRGRIELREDNVLWLLRNLGSNNKDRPEFQTAIDLLKRISE